MFIYKITNTVNGKVYIGLDSGPTKAERRWKYHRRNHRTGKQTIYFAMRKYSIDKFSYEVIDDNISNRNELLKREIYWIAYFDSTKRDKGYNRTLGGEGTYYALLDDAGKKLFSRNITLRNLKRWATISDAKRKEHGRKISENADRIKIKNE
jgi:hypothetical protein